MHSLAALATLLLRMEQVKTTPLGISLPAGRAPSCPPFAPRHGGAHSPGHQLFQASLPLLTLTTLSGVPFPFFSTDSLFKPQISCHLLCEVLSGCSLYLTSNQSPLFPGYSQPPSFS